MVFVYHTMISKEMVIVWWGSFIPAVGLATAANHGRQPSTGASCGIPWNPMESMIVIMNKVIVG